MKKSHGINDGMSKERIADLLKERIYATLALLAVLINTDTRRYSPIHCALIICGTIVSLWAASIVSSLMARRVVYQDNLNHDREREDQLRRHAPMLASLIFPLLMLLLTMAHILSLSAGINISIAASLLLLVGWSILSARSLRAKKIPTIFLVIAELLIGIGIVSLKVVLER